MAEAVPRHKNAAVQTNRRGGIGGLWGYLRIMSWDRALLDRELHSLLQPCVPYRVVHLGKGGGRRCAEVADLAAPSASAIATAFRSFDVSSAT